MQSLREEFEAVWQRHVGEHSFWQAWSALDPESAGFVRDSLQMPGKRLRPLLFGLACQAFGCDSLTGLMPAALALELAHNFILVHDDVIDGSDERRGVPSLSKRLDNILRDKPSGNFNGNDVALVTGDILYSLAMDSLAQTAAPAERVLAAIQEFMRAALDTGRGTLLEIGAARTRLNDLSTADIERVYALKTGSYSFAMPIRLAALLTGGTPSFAFDKFGVHAGIAFQLKNDRQGLQGWLQGGRLPDDLRDGRHIWATVYAWGAADISRRQMFDQPPGAALREVFCATETLAAMDQAIVRHAQAALACVTDPALSAFVAEMLRP